jgi:hypothetical protein
MLNTSLISNILDNNNEIMKYIQYILVLSILFASYGCSTPDESAKKTVIPNESQGGDLSQGQIATKELATLDYITISIGDNIEETNEGIIVPIVFENTENISYPEVKGITFYIEEIGSLTQEISAETTALTEGWLIASDVLAESNVFKAVLVNLSPLTENGHIANLVIAKESLVSSELLGREYTIYGEIADGEEIYKTQVTTVSL